jgi:hypothetical protein
MLKLVVVAVVGASSESEWDVVVYGATPGGIAAAFAACEAPMNTSASQTSMKVLLIEPTADLGGMTSPGGIGLRDIGNDISKGYTREWAMLNAEHYNVTNPQWQPDNWVGNMSWWKLILDSRFQHCLTLRTNTALLDVGVPSVVKQGSVIQSIAVSSTTPIADTGTGVVTGRLFVDASYEGDLLAAAGVSFIVGRESAEQYGEPYAGVRPLTSNISTNFLYPVSPLLDPEGPVDGPLVKYVHPGPVSPAGSADENVMAFSYRYCLTKVPSNQAPFLKPDGYNSDDFLLFRRTMAAYANHNQSLTPGHLFYLGGYHSKVPKFDLCDSRFFPVTSDAPQENVGYWNGSRATRRMIADKHYYYVSGLLYCLAHDPACVEIPADARAAANLYGLCADEWPGNGHRPTQMYVRDGIRMVGDKVATYNDMNRTLTSNDSVGVGGWGVDLHAHQRLAVKDPETGAMVATDEGMVRSGAKNSVFELAYSILVPKRDEVVNLLVVSCPSVSHVFFGAIREEPTLMQLGQVAGTAAKIALLHQTTVQGVPYPLLRASLLAQGLAITPSTKPPTPSPPGPPAPISDVYLSACNNSNSHQLWDVRPVVATAGASLVPLVTVQLRSSLQLPLSTAPTPAPVPPLCLTSDGTHVASHGHGQSIAAKVCASGGPTKANQMWVLAQGKNRTRTHIKLPTPQKCLDYPGECQCCHATHKANTVELWACGSSSSTWDVDSKTGLIRLVDGAAVTGAADDRSRSGSMCMTSQA